VTLPAEINRRKRFRDQFLADLHDRRESGWPRTHSEKNFAALLNAALERCPSWLSQFDCELPHAYSLALSGAAKLSSRRCNISCAWSQMVMSG
jgi:hypothetical protein